MAAHAPLPKSASLQATATSVLAELASTDAPTPFAMFLNSRSAAALASRLLSAQPLVIALFASQVPANTDVPTVSCATFPPCPSAAALASPQSSAPPPEIAPFASQAPASTDALPAFATRKRSSSDIERQPQPCEVTITLFNFTNFLCW